MVTDVVGWSSAARSVGLMLGPPFGGFMYQVGGFHLPFAVAASMLCVSAIGFIFFSRQRKPQAVSGQHQATKLSEKAKSQSLAASVSGSTFLGADRTCCRWEEYISCAFWPAVAAPLSVGIVSL